AVCRRVEAAAAATARPRRGRAAGTARALRDRGPRGDGRNRGAADGALACGGPLICRVRRRTTSDRGRVAARSRGGAARARRAARLELDGERAHRRPDALRHPQGRLGMEGGRLRVVRRRRPAGAGVLAEAPPDGPARTLVADRLPAGGRPVRPLEGIRVVEAATLFAAPLAGMLLGDYG